jgi:alcohol dehydrogenase
MAASSSFESSVFPFILKGVNLLGVDSVEMPIEQKQHLWSRLARAWQAELPDGLIKEVDLPEAIGCLQAFLQGRVMGRILVNVNNNRGC